MYKLFLCLKYLRRRYLAVIAVLAVALCVFMVLVTVSVFDGFLRKVESAAKGLFGDIIVDAPSLSAIGRYDEFIAELTGQCRVDADFSLTVVRPAETGREVVFAAKAGSAQAEALAGGLYLQSPVEHPARALVFKGGRLLGELHGRLVLEPGQEIPDSKELAYPVRFTARTDLPAEQLGDPLDPVSLRDVYARLGEGLAEIESASPVIYTYGLLRIGQDFTTAIQICGIRLPERLGVTDFGTGLFVQEGRGDASFDPPLRDLVARTREHLRLIELVSQRGLTARPERRDPELLRKLRIALDNATEMLFRLRNALLLQDRLRQLQSDLAAEEAKPKNARDESKTARLRQQIEQTFLQLDQQIRGPGDRMILGLGIGGLSFRTPAGETIRWVTPGKTVTLTLLPVGRGRLATTITPNTRTFAVVDDAKTDVWTVDSNTVYVPFETLQQLGDMQEGRDVDDPTEVDPARCSQIQIKVKQPFSTDRRLVEVRKKVQALWREFEQKHPDASGSEIFIHTWREKLAKFIGPVQKQRALVTIMFGIISFVSVLLIFAIFYMIVVQKTRDIGVVRAVGGTAPGIAQIFLVYGAVTGALGSILGLISGYFFVRYINQIEDWLASWYGFRVWERDVFLFEKIPNEVDASVAVVIAVWAIASGLIGALIPAVRAAVMEPAEAVRYE